MLMLRQDQTVHDLKVTTAQPSQRETTARPAMTDPEVHGGSEARTHNLLRFTPEATSPSAHERCPNGARPCPTIPRLCSNRSHLIAVRLLLPVRMCEGKETAVPWCDPGDTARAPLCVQATRQANSPSGQHLDRPDPRTPPHALFEPRCCRTPSP